MRIIIAGLLLAVATSANAAEQCIASIYTTKESWGQTTASGRPLRDDALTVAHLTKPFGSKVTITNLSNRRRVTAIVTDRGPYKRGRCVDTTLAVAHALGFSGLARVQVE